MKLSTKQAKTIKESTARINLWIGAVRSGKTVASILRFLTFLSSAPTAGDMILIGKSQGSLYRNVIKPLRDLVGRDVRYYSGKQQLNLWGRTMYCMGAYDETSEGLLRGMTAAGGYGDEVTLWPESFFKMALSRLSLSGSQFFGSTNPDTPYHWLKQFIERPGLDLKYFNFTIDDNPFLPPEYVANLKKEYTGLWYKRFIDGIWTAAEGSIYDFFDEAIHVIDRPPGKALEYYVSSDYGTGNPSAFGLFGRNHNLKPAIWLEREYYYSSRENNRQKTDSEYADDMIRFISPTITPIYTFVDPSAASFMAELRRRGVMGVTPADNDVLDGIRTQSRVLKSGEYAICKCCQRTIKDYFSYRWDDRAQKRGEDKPLKIDDHTKDMERYCLYSLYGKRTLDYSLLTRW